VYWHFSNPGRRFANLRKQGVATRHLYLLYGIAARNCSQRRWPGQACLINRVPIINPDLRALT